ncbi:MAG: hypothetical protein IH595_09925 [Bacteroidales bacterium]|nr:hypothetical protein [Bacteroidales bacterium]
MKTRFLFPHRFKKAGWFLLIPTFIIGFFVVFFDFEPKFLEGKMFTIYTAGIAHHPIIFGLVDVNLTNTIVGVLCLIGALLVAFSKEKNEDEFIANTRFESLLWATYVNYGVLIFCFLFFYAFEFLSVMILNMFTILFFFIARFHFILYFKNAKSMSHEE